MKFYDSHTNKEFGESYVVVEHRGNYYTGKAAVHPDDTWSEFTGCRYAQERAEIKALKAEWREAKRRCEECRRFVKTVTHRSLFDKEDNTAKAMMMELEHRINEVNKLADAITKKDLALRLSISEQNKVNKIIEHKNSIKQNTLIENK